MTRPHVLALVLAALVAGCADPSAPVTEADPEEQAASEVQWWTHTLVLSTLGSAQVDGLYVHPNSQGLAPNCVSIDVGQTLQSLRVEASWEPGPDGATDLVVFHWLTGLEAPFSDRAASVGPSPLLHEAAFTAGNDYLMVGVEPAPDLPVGVGTVAEVSITITLGYLAPMAPAVRKAVDCVHDM